MSTLQRSYAVILVAYMVFAMGCSCKSAQFRPLDAALPNSQQEKICNTNDVVNSYYSIKEEFIAYNPPKQSYLGKLIQKCKRDLLITMNISMQYSLAGIPNQAITASIPIYYLSYNESTNEFSENSLKGSLIFPKYGLKENDILQVSFRMTETQKMDSGEILSILNSASEISTILLMPQVTASLATINSISTRIDAIINRNFEYSQNITGGLTLTADSICNYTNIAIVNKEDTIKLLSDWQSIPKTQEQCLSQQCLRTYDYIMLSINHHPPFIHDIASLRESTAWTQIASNFQAELKSRTLLNNWMSYFESTVIPFINNLHIARKDASLIKAYLLYQCGITIDETTPQTIISQDELEAARSINIRLTNPKIRVAKDFIEAWRIKSNSFNSAASNNIYITGDRITSTQTPVISLFENYTLSNDQDLDDLDFRVTDQGKVKIKTTIQQSRDGTGSIGRDVRITISYDSNNLITGVNIAEIH